MVIKMFIKIDITSAVPVYAQIVDQIKHLVATGVMKSGDSLPSLRETAMLLRVNPLTVAKAYKQLEIEGLIETQHGKGSFISNKAKPVVEDYKNKMIEKSINKLLFDAFNVNMSIDDLQKIIESKIDSAKSGKLDFYIERKSDDENK